MPQINSAVDLNDYKETGNYYITHNGGAVSTNMPVQSNGLLEVVNFSYIRQTFTQGSESNLVYRRTYRATIDKWSEWKSV